MAKKASESLRVANELLDAVRRVRDEPGLLDAMAGNRRWRTAANRLPYWFVTAEKVIQPLLSGIKQSSKYGTIEWGHLSATTGFELALQIGEDTIELLLLCAILRREIDAGRVDRDLTLEEQLRILRRPIRERFGWHGGDFFNQQRVAPALDFFKLIGRPAPVEWSRLRARLELEADLIDQAKRDSPTEGNAPDREAAKRPAFDAAKVQEQFDALGPKLDELTSRLGTIEEVPGIAKVGMAAHLAEVERKTPKEIARKPRRGKAHEGKIRLGQALQYDWQTYLAQGNPNDENEIYDDWRIDNGQSGDFELTLGEAKELRRWFAYTHTKDGRHPGDAVSLEKGFELSDDDKTAIAEWLKSQRKGKK